MSTKLCEILVITATIYHLFTKPLDSPLSDILSFRGSAATVGIRPKNGITIIGYYGLRPKGTSSRCALRAPRTFGARNDMEPLHSSSSFLCHSEGAQRPWESVLKMVLLYRVLRIALQGHFLALRAQGATHLRCSQ